MDRFTVLKIESGGYRVKKNAAPESKWFVWFDYVIDPDEHVSGVAVQIGPDPDDSTKRWFEDIARGIQLETARIAELKQRELFGIRITIRKVISHDIDTSPRGCESAGRQLVYDFLLPLATQVRNSDA
jgi:hypothetical protein